MFILGINAYHGDSSAALLHNGQLVAAVEEERFRRIKHWAGFPSESIRYCLAHAGIGIEQIDHIALSFNPKANVGKKALFALTQRPSLQAILDRLGRQSKTLGIRDELASAFGVEAESIRAKLHNVEHHDSHLASGFFTSPFKQAALLSEVANADVVITTAAVPGRKAPILLTQAMVEAMGEGSLVIDMAADGGGNCELTRAGETVVHQGVRVVGLTNPPAEMGASASFMYANNVLKLLGLFGAKGELQPDWNDEVVRGVTVARQGQVNHAPTAEKLGVAHVAIVAEMKEEN